MDCASHRRTSVGVHSRSFSSTKRYEWPFLASMQMSDDKPKPPKEKRISLKSKVADAEAEMTRINGIIEKIDAALALPDLFTRDPKQAAQLSKARAAAADALQRAEEQWLEASAEYEDANG